MTGNWLRQALTDKRKECPMTEEQQEHTQELPSRSAPYIMAEDVGEETDLSLLLQQTVSDVTEHMSEEEKASYIANLFAGEKLDQNTQLFTHVIPQISPSLTVTNYKPDQAMREASLARESQWMSGDGEISYLASNTLEVYLGTPEHPLEIPQALQHIRQLSESTVLTSRILLGLWNSRRRNAHVSKGDSVAVLL